MVSAERLPKTPGDARRHEPPAAPLDNLPMKNLRPHTLGILERVEALSGRPVELKPDSSLTLRATLQIARNGAPAHVLRYRPSNDPLDYLVAYQAGYALRLFELAPSLRFDFAGTGTAPGEVETLLRTGQPLTEGDKGTLPQFAQMTAHWALLNLRSYAIGLRIDQWLADEHPELGDLQVAGMHFLQQDNLQLLSIRFGNLSVPVPLLAPVAAYALYADRLLGKSAYAIPYRASGVVDGGQQLLDIVDSLPAESAFDTKLVDSWAAAVGMTGWFAWIPYKP